MTLTERKQRNPMKSLKTIKGKIFLIYLDAIKLAFILNR